MLRCRSLAWTPWRLASNTAIAPWRCRRPMLWSAALILRRVTWLLFFLGGLAGLRQNLRQWYWYNYVNMNNYIDMIWILVLLIVHLCYIHLKKFMCPSPCHHFTIVPYPFFVWCMMVVLSVISLEDHGPWHGVVRNDWAPNMSTEMVPSYWVATCKCHPPRFGQLNSVRFFGFCPPLLGCQVFALTFSSIFMWTGVELESLFTLGKCTGTWEAFGMSNMFERLCGSFGLHLGKMERGRSWKSIV